MRVSPISVNYLSNGQRIQRRVKQENPIETAQSQLPPNFKGGEGAAKGILYGFATGFAATALIIATGGLAGVVAAVGSAGGTCLAGGAACTHLGGIIGGLISDN